MPAITGATIAAALGAAALQGGASLGSTVYSTERNLWNANEQAQKQRDFEKNMSSTAYQRAVHDMEAAGLNPNLILGNGAAASTPVGSSATGNYGSVSAPNFGNIFSSAVAAAMSKDKNLTKTIVQELRDETALQVQRLRNEGAVQNEIQKKELGHASYRGAKGFFRSRDDEPQPF